MKPLFFDSMGKQLLGLYHPAAGAIRPSGAVVFCNPFGQEAIRSHRMYRVLADRVARGGRSALRFDYSSTGDSEGSCTDAMFSRWVEDIRAADREVRRLSGAETVTWVGLRLGATLAVMAAAANATAPHRLVLWDPVISGRAYLEELARSHVGFIAGVFRWTPERAARSRGVGSLAELTELVGFEVSDSLRAEIGSINLESLVVPDGMRITILGNRGAEACPAMVDALSSRGIAAEYVPIEDDTPWNSEEALNASTIPALTLDALLAAVERGS